VSQNNPFIFLKMILSDFCYSNGKVTNILVKHQSVSGKEIPGAFSL
jgi:hypothetical protein